MIIKLTKSKKVAIIMSIMLSVTSANGFQMINALNVNNDLTNKIIKNEAKDSNTYPFKINDQGVLIEYHGNDKKVVIPEGVKKISFGAFINNDKIEKVVFPEGLELIDECAFYGCSSLKDIVLPESLESIGRLAFGNCINCKKVYLGEKFKSIGEFAFWKCDSLKYIDVNKDNKDYSSYKGLLYTSDYHTLKLCPSGMAKNIRLIDSTKVIGEYAFFDCKNVESVYMTGFSPVTISDSAFYGCENLKDVKIDSGIKEIGSCAFAECKSLTEFTVGDKVKSIGSSAFLKCTSLNKVKFLPKNIEIGHNLFALCTQRILVSAEKGSSGYDYVKKHPKQLRLV